MARQPIKRPTRPSVDDRPLSRVSPGAQPIYRGAAEMAREEALPVEDGRVDLGADASLHPAYAAPVEAQEGEESLAAVIARIRNSRQDLGAFDQKLAIAKIPGYYVHWFNDTPGRVERAVANGWAFVQTADGQNRSFVVGSGRDGAPLKAFAMKLPAVIWEEDQRAKEAASNQRLDATRKSPFQAPPGTAQKSDQGKFYSPNDAPLTIHKA